MKRIICIFIICAVICSMYGCFGGSTTENTYPAMTQSSATAPADQLIVGNRVYTMDEILQGFADAINKDLYYNGVFYYDLDATTLVNNTLECELFYNAGNQEMYSMIVMTITGAKRSLSAEESIWYDFAIYISESGLSSEICLARKNPEKANYRTLHANAISLGTHTLAIPEITQPGCEAMTGEWKESAKIAINRYMSENDFYADKEDNLKPGKYRVYIKGFLEGDWDADIYFEHEDGSVYSGTYCFVHTIAPEKPADLNHVQFDEYLSDDSNQEYMEKLYKNAVLTMEYTVL